MIHNEVFVSYSHADSAWLNRLQVHLKPLQRAGLITLWDDTRIKPGSQWRTEIREALGRARVAVLLVSADFLASDFISTNELPPLLAAAEKKGTLILPVIVSPCRFTQTPSLACFQTVNPPDVPLVRMRKAKREDVFVRLSSEIERALSSETAQILKVQASATADPSQQPDRPAASDSSSSILEDQLRWNEIAHWTGHDFMEFLDDRIRSTGAKLRVGSAVSLPDLVKTASDYEFQDHVNALVQRCQQMGWLERSVVDNNLVEFTSQGAEHMRKWKDLSQVLFARLPKPGIAAIELFVTTSDIGAFGRPSSDFREFCSRVHIDEKTGIDLVEELVWRGFLKRKSAIGRPILLVEPTDRLFWDFDTLFFPWHPEWDAGTLASKLVNAESKQVTTVNLARDLGWEVRRINPALTWLVENRIVEYSKMSSHPFAVYSIIESATTRRFLQQPDKT